jgi:hypothetical protein
MNEINKTFNILDIKLGVELDQYDRNYVTMHNLNYLKYSDDYFNGFIGNSAPFSTFPEVSNYIKKSLFLFERIKYKQHKYIIFIYDDDDLIKLSCKIIQDIYLLKSFLNENLKFLKAYQQKVNEIYEHLYNKIKKGNNKYKILFKKVQYINNNIN